MSRSDSHWTPPSLDELDGIAPGSGLPVQDKMVIRAALERDIPWVQLHRRTIQLGWGRHQVRLRGTFTGRTSRVAADIASDKVLTNALLGSLGLPVTRMAVVRRWEDAVYAADRLGYPVVIKPRRGNRGRGVHIGLADPPHVREAALDALRIAPELIVERFVPGHDFRLLVVGGELVAAARRVPAHVRGDGVHTVNQLISLVNQDPRRGPGSRRMWTRLSLDAKAQRELDAAGYTPETVLEAGKVLALRRNANTSDGGTAVDVIDDLHPEVAELARRAAAAIGLDVAGVDLIAEDIGAPVTQASGAIIEVNARPGIRKHMWPAAGRARNAAEAVVAALYPEGAPSRIPLAVVVGSESTPLLPGLLTAILSEGGARARRAAASDSQHAGGAIASGGIPAPLLDPEADAAVIELGAGALQAHAFGFDRCDVAAIVDFGALAGGELGDEALARALYSVAARSRSVVLEWQDEDEAAALSKALGDRVVWVRLDADPEASPETGPGAPVISIGLADGKPTVQLDTAGQRRSLGPLDRLLGRPTGATHPTPPETRRAVLHAAAMAFAMDVPLSRIAKALARPLPPESGNFDADHTPEPEGRATTRVPEAEDRGDLQPPDSLDRVRAAAEQAAGYLLRALQPSGRFTYRLGIDGTVQSDRYNFLRHAGAVYALGQYARGTQGEDVRAAIVSAASYLLDRHIEPVRDDPGALAIWSDPNEERSDTDRPEAKLGGTALGLIALIEGRRLQPDLVSLDGLRALGRFLLFMQAEDGHFRSKYESRTGFAADFESIYYPGEAVLALLTLAGVDRETDWRSPAQRAAIALARSRMGWADRACDHWFLLAGAELMQRVGNPSQSVDPALTAYAGAICRDMLAEQDLIARVLPELAGSFVDDGRVGANATRLEGLLAMERLLREAPSVGAPAGIDRHMLVRAIDRGMALMLQCQVPAGPARGGFIAAAQGAAAVATVRIDQVQHSLSALVAYLEMRSRAD